MVKAPAAELPAIGKQQALKQELFPRTPYLGNDRSPELELGSGQ